MITLEMFENIQQFIKSFSSKINILILLRRLPYVIVSRPLLSITLTTSHMCLFKCKVIKIKYLLIQSSQQHFKCSIFTGGQQLVQWKTLKETISIIIIAKRTVVQHQSRLFIIWVSFFWNHYTLWVFSIDQNSCFNNRKITEVNNKE